MVKLRLLEKMTMLMISSCTIMGVPRMMVAYTSHTALKKPSTGFLWPGRCWSWVTRTMATTLPSTTPRANAMAVTSRVVPTPSMYWSQRSFRRKA